MLHLEIQLRSEEKRETSKKQPPNQSFPDLLIRRGLGGGGLVLIPCYHQKILKSFQIHFCHSGILGIKVHKLVTFKASSCQALPASGSRCSWCSGSSGPFHTRHSQQGTSAPWRAENEPKPCWFGFQSEMWAPAGRTGSENHPVDRWGTTLELLQVPACGLMLLGVVEPPLEVSAGLVAIIIIIIIPCSPDVKFSLCVLCSWQRCQQQLGRARCALVSPTSLGWEKGIPPPSISIRASLVLGWVS